MVGPDDTVEERLYTPFRGVMAEGARIGLCVCRKCGMTMLLDPDLKFDVLALHAGTHGLLDEYLSQTAPPPAPAPAPARESEQRGPRHHFGGAGQG